MNSLIRHGDQGAPRLVGQSARATGRSRRADEGAVTEMARSLLRDAREAAGAEAGCGHGGLAWEATVARRELAGSRRRLSSRPFATRRA
jgi:hypothetical protein